jgi:hypothetical protein
MTHNLYLLNPALGSVWGHKKPPEARLVKITHVKLSQLQTPNSRGKRLVTICAALDKPDEFMTITVSVPNGPDQLRVRETGVARAKDFAKQFADPSLSSFSTQDHVVVPASEQTKAVP